MFLLEVSAGEHDLAVAAGMNVNCHNIIYNFFLIREGIQ